MKSYHLVQREAEARVKALQREALEVRRLERGGSVQNRVAAALRTLADYLDESTAGHRPLAGR